MKLVYQGCLDLTDPTLIFSRSHWGKETVEVDKELTPLGEGDGKGLRWGKRFYNSYLG